jgi:hypothetical protein
MAYEEVPHRAAIPLKPLLLSLSAALVLVVGAVLLFSPGPNAADTQMDIPMVSFFNEDGYDTREDTTACTSDHFTKMTIQVLGEHKFAGLLTDVMGSRKFEGSDVVRVGGYYWVVFDSLWSIGRFAQDFSFYNPINQLVTTPPHPVLEESGFEAIVHNEKTGSFFLVQESILGDDMQYRARIQEVSLYNDAEDGQYNEVGPVCATSHAFEGDSKGLEGATGVWDHGEFKILGLCEGNSCSQTDGVKDDPGHGEALLLSLVTNSSTGECQWVTEKIIKIPPTAFFTDYSAISMTDSGKVAITSQENATVWIGTFSNETMEFGEGYVFNFPRNDRCEMVYCNVEGVSWVDEEAGTLVAATDAMKSHGRQPPQCQMKDQSMLYLQIPKDTF